MCLLLIAYRQHPRFPLLILANRDEFYGRETAAAHPWPDHRLTAGRDLEAGGTWLGVAAGGRVAAVTNMREPQVSEPENVLSRGEIPVHFLDSDRTPTTFARDIPGERYRGFNALLFDARLLADGAATPLVCAGNRHRPFAMTPGVHGISNGAPDAPWPKVTHGCAALAALVTTLPTSLDHTSFVAPALQLLSDQRRAPADQLPDTGVGGPLESALSPIFVRIAAGDPAGGPLARGYGTRASSLVAVNTVGDVQFWEQTYTDGRVSGPPRYFHIPPN
ncbi:NRDE family protein [Microbulbifer elongatus]|uniref:NRDE family protein n=1 Tax=Microbulbifer elongatus TaxID=86173 RepID=A0ABT1NY80_9GAMM|nr:NRDE family protein [Microbulbifer elongatus]MCQ3828798.1 NRDE family protein [Microbulbifer elongatus]